MSAQTTAPPTTLRDLIREVAELRKTINTQKGKQLHSNRARGDVRTVVQNYFRAVRPSLTRLMIDTSATDTKMQLLLQLASRNSSISIYKKSLATLLADLNQQEIESELQISDHVAHNDAGKTSPVERQIIATVERILPPTARSYRQVLLDISDPERLSYRGTATELREILRETLDYLAPDKDVVNGPGFQLEKDRTKPTMAQKARYILRIRGLAKNSIEVPRKAIEIVEDTVASLVRSTYDRGSIDTHTSSNIGRPGVSQLKMYVDSILCELLEIHSKG